MNNWGTVFSYELVRQFKRKAFLITTFGLPLLAGLIFGAYVLYTDVIQSAETEQKMSEDAAIKQDEFDNDKPIGYVDLTTFFAAPDPQSPLAPLITQYRDISEGQAALQAGEVEALYVIEQDYFKTGEVTLWLDKININAFDSNLMEAFLVQSLAGDTNIALIARLRLPIVSLTQERIQQGSSKSEASSVGGDFLVVYVFALALMVSTFTASGYLMQSIVEEKESKTIEILLTSVKPFPLLMGKTAAMGLLGMLQILVWLSAAAVLLNAAAGQIVDLGAMDVKPVTVIIGIIYFVLGYGFTGAIFAALGSLTNSTREGSQLAGWVIFPTIIPLFFSNSFAQDPNGSLATALSIIPITAPLGMVMRSAITNVPLIELVASLSLLVLLMFGGMWLAARFFRVSSLLRGETQFRPRLILRYLFERSEH